MPAKKPTPRNLVHEETRKRVLRIDALALARLFEPSIRQDARLIITQDKEAPGTVILVIEETSAPDERRMPLSTDGPRMRPLGGSGEDSAIDPLG